MVRIHIVVGGFSNAEDVWRNFQPILAFVSLQNVIGIDAQICVTYMLNSAPRVSRTC